MFSSHSFWTSSSLDVPAGVTQKDGHTGFFIHLLSAVRALIFLARRIQPFLSLVDREVGPSIVHRNRKRFILSQSTLREEFVEKKYQVFDIIGLLTILVRMNLSSPVERV